MNYYIRVNGGLRNRLSIAINQRGVEAHENLMEKEYDEEGEHVAMMMEERRATRRAWIGSECRMEEDKYDDVEEEEEEHEKDEEDEEEDGKAVDDDEEQAEEEEQKDNTPDKMKKKVDGGSLRTLSWN